MDLLQTFTSGKDFAAYTEDAMLQAAVERKLMIIGEAMVQLARVDESTAEQIGEFRRIISFRNRLVHLYDDLDLEVVWDVLISDLPKLQEDVQKLLATD